MIIIQPIAYKFSWGEFNIRRTRVFKAENKRTWQHIIDRNPEGHLEPLFTKQQIELLQQDGVICHT